MKADAEIVFLTCLIAAFVNGCILYVKATEHNPCEGELRIVSGRDNSSGFVEVYFRGAWGGICDHYWKVPAARVACRQLGYTDGVPKLGAKYEFDIPHDVMDTREHLPVHISSVLCAGTEPIILHCNYSSVTRCHPDDHVAVNCIGARVYDAIDVCSYTFHGSDNSGVRQKHDTLTTIINNIIYLLIL